jgi:hypothetical protein
MAPALIRIASGQCFWGDLLSAPGDQVRGGPIDYLMLDYLAEVTMSILQKQKARDPARGYARDFVQVMRDILPDCVDRDIRVIANAGGVNPRGCTDAVLEVARAAGLAGKVRLGTITGDDLLHRLDALIAAGHELRNLETGEPLATIRDRVQSANAYLGARPIVSALAQGARVVITGRSTDTALTYAPMIYAVNWAANEYDRLAAGVVAGHINECGAQASGGNSLVGWRDFGHTLARVGFPIVEASADGSFVVTKHQGTGGRVDRAIVSEQILYELGDPRQYITPDVVADFTTIRLEELGRDRVRVTGVRGGPPTDRLKVSISYSAGYKAVGTLVYAWPDAVEKARLADRILRERLDRMRLRFDAVRTELVGWNATHGPLAGPPRSDAPEVELRFAVRAASKAPVEAFTRELAPLILTGPPSVTGFAGGRPRTQEIVAYWPALIDRNEVEPYLSMEVREA